MGNVPFLCASIAAAVLPGVPSFQCINNNLPASTANNADGSAPFVRAQFTSNSANFLNLTHGHSADGQAGVISDTTNKWFLCQQDTVTIWTTQAGIAQYCSYSFAWFADPHTAVQLELANGATATAATHTNRYLWYATNEYNFCGGNDLGITACPYINVDPLAAQGSSATNFVYFQCPTTGQYVQLTTNSGSKCVDCPTGWDYSSGSGFDGGVSASAYGATCTVTIKFPVITSWGWGYCYIDNTNLYFVNPVAFTTAYTDYDRLCLDASGPPSGYTYVGGSGASGSLSAYTNSTFRWCWMYYNPSVPGGGAAWVGADMQDNMGSHVIQSMQCTGHY